jgi:glycosyltransferase involved in cell wall biosynthesis
MRAPRVAIAHDWLVRYGGSERCVHELLHAFPGARLLTTLARPECLPPAFAGAQTSWLQHVPGATSHHEWFVPLMPITWRSRAAVGGVDAVISSSHACAKAVRVAEGLPHICYCHTPMRYAWHYDQEVTRFPRLLRHPLRYAMRGVRSWDRRTAANVDRFVANSTAVAARIRRFYGRSSTVIHPPVDTEYFTPDAGGRDDYFVYVGRLVPYKRPDAVVRAFAGLPFRLLVVGDGPMRKALQETATPNVSFQRDVSPDELRAVYRRSRGLIHLGVEDFGIAMAEAQACGTPVIALDGGGARDIVVIGATGLLIADARPSSVAEAVEVVAATDFDASAIRRNAERFSAERFRDAMLSVVSDCVEGHPAAIGA